MQITANDQAASKGSRGVVIGHISGLTMNLECGSGHGLANIADLYTLFCALYNTCTICSINIQMNIQRE